MVEQQTTKYLSIKPKRHGSGSCSASTMTFFFTNQPIFLQPQFFYPIKNAVKKHPLYGYTFTCIRMHIQCTEHKPIRHACKKTWSIITSLYVQKKHKFVQCTSIKLKFNVQVRRRLGNTLPCSISFWATLHIVLTSLRATLVSELTSRPKPGGQRSRNLS